MLKGQNFGAAIEALNNGKMVAREGWNRLFIFRQVPSEIGENIVPKMQSLPQAVKDEFAKRGGVFPTKINLQLFPQITLFLLG